MDNEYEWIRLVDISVQELIKAYIIAGNGCEYYNRFIEVVQRTNKQALRTAETRLVFYREKLIENGEWETLDDGGREAINQYINDVEYLPFLIPLIDN